MRCKVPPSGPTGFDSRWASRWLLRGVAWLWVCWEATKEHSSRRGFFLGGVPIIASTCFKHIFVFSFSPCGLQTELITTGHIFIYFIFSGGLNQMEDKTSPTETDMLRGRAGVLHLVFRLQLLRGDDAQQGGGWPIQSKAESPRYLAIWLWLKKPEFQNGLPW